MSIKLYDLVGKNGMRYSPYGWRIRMALAHKGLDVTYELCWHSDRNKLKFSGQSLVPVLVDNDRIVHDSWNIACYLDDAYPDRPMLMEGAQGRAFSRFVNGWMDTQIGRPLVRSMYLDILNSLHPDADRDDFRRRKEERAGNTLEALRANRAKDFDELNRNFAPMNELLRYQPFVSGNAPGYPDYIVFGTLQMPRCLNGVEVLSDRNEATLAWRERMRRLFNGLADSAPTFDRPVVTASAD
jgi:glutathione S-transferase